MAASFLQRSFRLSNYFIKRKASSSAAVPLTDSLPHLPSIETVPTTVSDAVKVTKLPNGVTVASRDSSSPYTSLAVYVKCGSRAENYGQQGLTHLLRTCAYLSTEEKTAFAIQREADYWGSNLSCTGTREHIIYSTDCLRGNHDQVLSSIFQSITNPTFIHYEVDREKERISLDNARAMSQPEIVVSEALHKSAFRKGLSNSLYCPPYNISRFNHLMLKDFWSEWYIGQHLTVVGVGIDHDSLVSVSKAGMADISEGMNQQFEKASYVGGNEVRIDGPSSLAHVGIVCKGTNLYSSTEAVAGVVQFLLGGGSRIKWGSGSATARLSKAVAANIDAPFAVRACNVRYSDNGLFGFNAISDGSVMGKVLSTAMKEFNEISKGNFSEADLTRAKNQYKADLLMNSEGHGCTSDIGLQVSLTGSYSTPQEKIKAIDSVSAQDVTTFIKTVFGTRPTLVGYGNLSTTPRLDELLSNMSFK